MSRCFANFHFHSIYNHILVLNLSIFFLSFNESFFNNSRYGPQLVRTECTTYSAGTVIVVSRITYIFYWISSHLKSYPFRYSLGVWYVIFYRNNSIIYNNKFLNSLGCNIQYGTVHSELSKFCGSSRQWKLCIRNYWTSESKILYLQLYKTDVCSFISKLRLMHRMTKVINRKPLLVILSLIMWPLLILHDKKLLYDFFF